MIRSLAASSDCSIRAPSRATSRYHPDMPSVEPVSDAEFVYRRIPLHFYRARDGHTPQIVAFIPSPNDATGLSVDRAALRTVEQAAKGTEGKQYHVARISVGELRRLGEREGFDLTVVPDPLPDNRAHARIPEINRIRYDQDKRSKERMKGIANLIVEELVREGSPLGHFVLVAIAPDER